MGRPKICNPCCGGGAGSSSSSSLRSSSSSSAGPSFSTTPCITRCIDSVAAAQYEVTISGIGTAICGLFCPPLNRTWTITMGVSTCSGSDSITTPGFCGAGSGPDAAMLLFLEATRVRLDLISVPSQLIARWTKNMSQPYDCLASHTLTLLSNPGMCSGIPASVDVSPV